MNALRTYTQINDYGNIILENLPFEKGAFVEILILPALNDEMALVKDWSNLFKDIQSNDISIRIDEKDIDFEIQEYRNSI